MVLREQEKLHVGSPSVVDSIEYFKGCDGDASTPLKSKFTSHSISELTDLLERHSLQLQDSVEKCVSANGQPPVQSLVEYLSVTRANLKDIHRLAFEDLARDVLKWVKMLPCSLAASAFESPKYVSLEESEQVIDLTADLPGSPPARPRIRETSQAEAIGFDLTSVDNVGKDASDETWALPGTMVSTHEMSNGQQHVKFSAPSDVPRLENSKDAEGSEASEPDHVVNVRSGSKRSVQSNASCVSKVSTYGINAILKQQMEEVTAGAETPMHVQYAQEGHFGSDVNMDTVKGSILSYGRIAQNVVYLVATCGLAFIFYAKATDLGGSSRRLEDHHFHRRLGGEASPLLSYIAYSVGCAGVVAFFLNMMSLPLLLGYLLAGVFLGPEILDIVHEHNNIADVSSLGLVFLLFMIGLELDFRELLKMGRVVITTGLLQFPICAGIMTSLFLGLEAAGFNFGSGKYAAMYCGVSTGISSTMIVVKLLSEHSEMDSLPGRLTVGILIFQDIWAIVILAIQPDIANPEVFGLFKTFVMIAILVLVSLAYAKFVMPAVFMYSSKSVELMLVVALAWCFCMCCFATLPFMQLSMELAALISGAALATFPYSAEFNGKIKYIRDFFIILFFVDLGVQIPPPTIEAIGMALLICMVVLLVRWIGIFCVVSTAGGAKRLACLATINLSQISEFALVICSLGQKYGHVKEDTLAILIYTFAFLGILSTYFIGFNYRLYSLLSRICRLCSGRDPGSAEITCTGELCDHRDIVFVGFHKIAAMLIAQLECYHPDLLARIHVVDYHEHIMSNLRRRGVTCAYGDISSSDVLEHAHHGKASLVVSSIPDHMLRGVTNLRILQMCKQLWPDADVIVTATTPEEACLLYEEGADYVLGVSKMCAEKLSELLVEHSKQRVTEFIESESACAPKGKRQQAGAFQHHRDKDNMCWTSGGFSPSFHKGSASELLKMVSSHGSRKL
jgi:Kef-type K+ transport system membrane component KefB